MLRRKVRIFKWSVPLWTLIAALMVFGIAAAAFALLSSNQVIATAQDAPQISERGGFPPTCTHTGASNSEGTCVITGSPGPDYVVTISGYDDGGEFEAVYEWEISGSETGTFLLTCDASALAGENVTVTFSHDCNVGSHSPGDNLEARVKYSFIGVAQPSDSFDIAGGVTMEFTRE